MSAAPSFRDSVPATLLQLLRCHCLHETPPPRLVPSQARRPSATPAPRTTARACNVQHHPCTAGVRSHPLTAQPPPMHAAYRRGPASSAAPSWRDSVPATPPHHLGSRFLHAPPLLDSPLQQLNIRYSPALHQGGLQHATSSPAHCRRSQAPAHSAAAADVRSVPLRSSDVSCVIPPRLGARL